MPVRTGKEYIDQIDAMKAEVWVGGEQVNGRISEHAAFKGVMKSQARLYDLQCNPDKGDLMTYRSPVTGNRVGASFLEPKTKEDLEMKRLMTQERAKDNGGMLGRAPDYMNTVVMTFASAAEMFASQDKRFALNMGDVYEEAREKDLCFTHTFINPQVNRSSYYQENFSQLIAAQVTSINEDGIIINGARLLATQGGITDEILVFPANTAAKREEMAYGFSIPSNTKGLKFICREPFSYCFSTFDHPLGSRFDELDAIVVFKDVLVPWERVFFYQNPEVACKIYLESSFTQMSIHQVTSRRIVKLEFILGVAEKLIEGIQIAEYQHIQEKMSEMIVGLESLKALLLASELHAKIDKWGLMAPDLHSLSTAVLLFPKLYPRCIEILQLIGASGLVSIPTKADFDSDIRDDLDVYLQGATVNAEERVQLFRLAWDLSMSAFGSRQVLYERLFFGDPIRLASGQYFSYDMKNNKKMVDDFLNQQD